MIEQHVLKHREKHSVFSAEENKSSRKIHGQPIREIKSTKNVKKMTRENKSTRKFLSSSYI